MTPDKLAVLLAGISAMLFTYLFFFGKKDDAVTAKGSIDILVKGGYSPALIIVKNNASTTLNFKRTDENSCLEEVILPDFKIKKYLPLNETVPVTITPRKKGNFPFSCGMNMYFGKIKVI